MVCGSEDQARKRKLIGSSFYKDKLEKMVEMIKKTLSDRIEKLEIENVDTGKPINIISELD